MTTGSLAILGAPRSGKSTWLGRVGLAIRSGRRALRLDGQPSSLDALNTLGRPLEDSKYPDRSPSQGAPVLDVRVRHADEVVHLHIADYNGEHVDNVWANRGASWDQTWTTRAHGVGVAVVIRADTLQRYAPTRLQSSVSRDDDGTDTYPDAAPDRDERADARKAPPTALAVVELLQLLRHVRGLAPGQIERGWRIAVVVTAWDAAPSEAQQQPPRAFVREELGLLDDLLATNFHPEDVRCFGLSATGGDLNDAGYRAKFEDGEVDDHGYVTWEGGDQRSGDVTLPLAWLLRGDEALR